MPLTLHLLCPSNPSSLNFMPAIARIHLSAWLTVGVYRTIYYGPESSYPAILAYNTGRHTKTFLSDPTSTYAVILDTDLADPPEQQAIACMKFNIFETSEDEETRQDTNTRETWPPFVNVALVDEFWGTIVRSRQKHGRHLGPHVSLDLLATDPTHHRRGAGRMLMRLLVDRADGLGLPAMLEASPEGLRLYESVGFERVGEFWMDLVRFADGGDRGLDRASGRKEGEGEGEGWYREVVMLRGKKGVS